MSIENGYSYYAFISYNHRDEKIAKRLQYRLEHYKLPSVARQEIGEDISLRPVFRYVSDLGVGILREKLKAELDKVTKEIFTEGMSDTDKAKAVFDYVYAMKVAGSSDVKDMMLAAYNALTTGEGDSYSLYCVSYYLLSELGFKVTGVVNQTGTTHCWCLVDMGSGWYNFDACNNAPKAYKCFMKTSAELAKADSRYWSYSTKLYPPTELVQKF